MIFYRIFFQISENSLKFYRFLANTQNYYETLPEFFEKKSEIP